MQQNPRNRRLAEALASLEEACRREPRLATCPNQVGEVLLEMSLRTAPPDALQRAWQADWSPLTEGLVGAHNLFVLGRGLGLAAAQEAALKFKETCGLHAEAYSSAEVKHGPMALVGPGFPVLCFAQPDETETGMLALNTTTIGGADAPFGGVKWSGHGHEDGPEGLAACLVTKTVHEG